MSFFKTIHVGFLNQVVLPKEEGKGGREGGKKITVGGRRFGAKFLEIICKYLSYS